ncbi:YrhC family protein [Mesobacillus maritimus]|uniref:YrhC family protein n=1 Tax=Mesobacillus maritimus TaxID=1643336 RepID=UPI00384BBCE9
MSLKQMFERMSDYRNFGIVLLAVGSLFFIGSIIPSDGQVMVDKYISTVASSVFLVISIIFFALSKSYRNKLIQTEEGQEYLMNQKRP